jgi:hypothetical protein
MSFQLLSFVCFGIGVVFILVSLILAGVGISFPIWVTIVGIIVTGGSGWALREKHRNARASADDEN